MRPYPLALTALLLGGALASAQTTNTPTTTTPTALDRHLLGWEAAMVKVQQLTAQLARIEKDNTFNKSVKYVGKAQYLKTGTGKTALNLARLKMWPDGKTEDEFRDQFICTGTYLYQYWPDTKEIRAYELPEKKAGQVADDNFLSFLFGMKAEEAKKRYDLKLAKEDDWYVYIDVVPRNNADKADFTRARVVLNKGSYLPRQLWFEQPNGSEVTWDIPRLDDKTKVERAIFDAPRAPAGWKIVTVPRNADPAPKVIRP
jgi:TIGR03009 family protein